MSAAALLETSIVLGGLEPPIPQDDLDAFITSFGIQITSVTESQARIARLAHRRYGRGNHNDSKAKLNFGDCFAYALAREKNEPLLFVGDDFTHTDITPALES
jgi:ribonuclease VapC